MKERTQAALRVARHYCVCSPTCTGVGHLKIGTNVRNKKILMNPSRNIR